MVKKPNISSSPESGQKSARPKLKNQDQIEVQTVVDSEIKDKIAEEKNLSSRFEYSNKVIFAILILFNLIILGTSAAYFQYTKTLNLQRFQSLEQKLIVLEESLTKSQVKALIEEKNLELSQKFQNFLNASENKVSIELEQLKKDFNFSETLTFLESQVSEIEPRLKKEILEALLEMESFNDKDNLDLELEQKINRIIINLDSLSQKVASQSQNFLDRFVNLETQVDQRILTRQENGKRSPTIIDKERETISKQKRPFSPNRAIDLNALIKTFPDLAYDVLKHEVRSRSGEGLWGNIVSAVRVNFIVRSVTPQAGSNYDAILSRAEDNLKRGNLKKVLLELDNLDGGAADIFSEWKKSLEFVIERSTKEASK